MPSSAETLASSVRLLRTHPVISVALGAAIVVSLCSVCAGLGALLAPWFVCELYGVQLAVAIGTRPPKTPAWVGAAFVLLCTVLVVATAGWLSALGFGPDVATADAASEPLPWPETLRRVGLIAGSTTLAIGFITPFLYAPLVLIDRGGKVGGAVIESAWLVAEGGVLRHLALASAVYFLQFSPALIAAMIVARTFERAATPFGLALALPLLPFTIPLGQGLLTASYVAARGRLASPRTVVARGGPPRTVVALLASSIVAPIAGLAMLGVSALRPSTPAPGPAPAGELVVDRAVDARGAQVRVPDTTLRVRVLGPRVEVLAGDADGVGELPRSWRGRVERVRIVRVRDVYAVEIHAADRLVHALVDRAGGRVDDAIRRRLEEHVPTWALAAILAAFTVCGALLVRALAPLGALRAACSDGAEASVRAYRTATAWGLAIAPFSLAALLGGLVSIGWP